MGSNCIFCKIADGQIPATKICDDGEVVCFLDINPVADGHTLVVPKEHFERFDDCPAELLAKTARCIAKVASAIVAALDCDGYNVLCNNGRVAGQLVSHLHFHVIPRSEGDGVFGHWPSYRYPDGKADKIAEKIRNNL